MHCRATFSKASFRRLTQKTFCRHLNRRYHCHRHHHYCHHRPHPRLPCVVSSKSSLFAGIIIISGSDLRSLWRLSLPPTPPGRCLSGPSPAEGEAAPTMECRSVRPQLRLVSGVRRSPPSPPLSECRACLVWQPYSELRPQRASRFAFRPVSRPAVGPKCVPRQAFVPSPSRGSRRQGTKQC